MIENSTLPDVFTFANPNPASLAEALSIVELAPKVKKKKVNIGCRNKPLPTFINVDIDPTNELADVIDDGLKLEKFEDGSLDEIHAVHMFEHLSHEDSIKALNAWYRKLKDGGKLYLSVPDAEKISALLLLLKDKKAVKALFYGSQLDEWDFHRSLHTTASLSLDMECAGFRWVTGWDYATTFPYNYVDTYASCVFPHMHKKFVMDNGREVNFGGIQLSLNLVGSK